MVFLQESNISVAFSKKRNRKMFLSNIELQLFLKNNSLFEKIAFEQKISAKNERKKNFLFKRHFSEQCNFLEKFLLSMSTSNTCSERNVRLSTSFASSPKEVKSSFVFKHLFRFWKRIRCC